MPYCVAADIYEFALTRGSIPNEGRLVTAVDTAADALELDEHGLSLDGPVRFRVEAGGTLPGGLVALQSYFAIPVDPYRFQVSATAGGAAVDLTTAGDRIVVIVDLPVDSAIAWADRFIDEHLADHPVPLDAPVPEIVKMTSAELAAHKLRMVTGSTSQTLMMIVDMAQKRLDRWAKGKPVRGTDAPPNVSLAASPTAAYTDARGWREHGGI